MLSRHFYVWLVFFIRAHYQNINYTCTYNFNNKTKICALMMFIKSYDISFFYKNVILLNFTHTQIQNFNNLHHLK